MSWIVVKTRMKNCSTNPLSMSIQFHDERWSPFPPMKPLKFLLLRQCWYHATVLWVHLFVLFPCAHCLWDLPTNLFWLVGVHTKTAEPVFVPLLFNVFEIEKISKSKMHLRRIAQWLRAEVKVLYCLLSKLSCHNLFHPIIYYSFNMKSWRWPPLSLKKLCSN